MSSMDEDEKYTENRDELLERFRQSLSKPVSERYFDEDDLIEIFDYAGDIGDDYLRVEALLCGARFFPDSEELLERRGIFYSQYSDSARQQFLSHGEKTDSFIFGILNLRQDPSATPEDSAQALERLLDGRQSLSDEDVIQLMEAVQDLGLYDWFKRHFDRISEKAEYATCFLYEAGMVAEAMQDFEFSAEQLETLTKLEPFNANFWMLLSRQYAQLDDAEKALAAIDYALAINPSDPLSLLHKARYCNALGRSRAEVLDLCRKSVELSNGAIEAVQYLAELYFAGGEQQKAIDLISKVLDDPEMGIAPPMFNPAEPIRDKNIELIPDLIRYGAPNADELIDRFYAASPENSEIAWCNWATQLSQQGHAELAHKVMAGYERNSGRKPTSVFAIEQNFMAQNFPDTLAEIQDYISTMHELDYDCNYPAIAVMHAISLARIGARKEALDFCQKFIETFHLEAGISVSQRLEKIGLLSIMIHLKEQIGKLRRESEWQRFDPLDIWK